MNYDLLLKQAEVFVSKYMRKRDNPKLVYHNFVNTQNIVDTTNQIAEHYSLKEEELFTVGIAACFLYVGYYKDSTNPLESSTLLAREFLNDAGIESNIVEQVKKCIMAPVEGVRPGNLLPAILSDADSFYFGTENFPAFNKLLRKEAELVNKIDIDKNEWKRQTIQKLEAHEYFTDYCKTGLGFIKQRNLERLKKKNPLLSLRPASSMLVPEDGPVVEKHKEKNREKLAKKNSPERTIETMFRTTSANSQRLSSQADTKAHIMISVNTIIISLMLGLRQLAQSSKLTIPVIMLMLVNLVTIIFSILATRPNVAKRKFTESDFEQNKVNLLFFGNFFSMNFENYSNAMLNIMGDKHSLHITMLRNLYEQGAVLAKKYRMLKISYNVFMYGLVVAVIFFLVAPKLF